jgi:putative glutamine amidotransferase
MRRPLIGLTTYTERQRISGRDVTAVSLPEAYVCGVNGSGGRAVLIPSDEPDIDILDMLDGLILSGGADVDPSCYGERPHATTVSRPARDHAELMLLRGALDRDLPVLGICRGLQLLAVAYGGRLHQHLPDALGSDRHRPATDPDAREPRYGEHLVTVAGDSLAHRALGAETILVNSFHHQGVADPGRLRATGWSTEDSLIEAAEDPDRRFVLAVQWHPEDTGDKGLFTALMEACQHG